MRSGRNGKLREKLTSKCPGSTVQSLDVCDGDVDDDAGTGNCLVCTDWRRAIEGIQSAYGPQ